MTPPIIKELSCKVVSFGFVEKDRFTYNFIIFYAKYFLFLFKCKGSLPELKGFNTYFDFVSKVDLERKNKTLHLA